MAYSNCFRHFVEKIECVECGNPAPVVRLPIRNIFIPVCSTLCLYSFLNKMHPKDNEIPPDILIEPYDSDGRFKSPFEQLTYYFLSQKFKVLYEPFCLAYNDTKLASYRYVPDFYLPEKGVFIEVKGRTTLGYGKLAWFARHITLYAITPEMCEAWGWTSISNRSTK